MRTLYPAIPLSPRCSSFLSGSTRNLNNGRGCSYGSKKKKNKNVDSRLKILGMTEESKSSITPKKTMNANKCKKEHKRRKSKRLKITLEKKIPSSFQKEEQDEG
jgi:hypothetical protein